MEENENLEKTKVVDIQPITKGRRVLVFLADFFLVFILSFLFFNAMVMPISSAILNRNEKIKESDNAAKMQFDILYAEKVMRHENGDDIYQYNDNVKHTMNCYLSYYSFEESDVLEEHPQYGHQEENEVIRHYFADIKDNLSIYLITLQSFNSNYDYFNIEGQNITLKDEVKTNIKLSFFSPKDMSKEGKTMLTNLQSGFMDFYASVFKDIKQYDLTSGGNSYLKNQAIVDSIQSFFGWHFALASIASYVLSVAVYHLLIPLINKDNRSLAMMMMRVSRIGTNNIYLLSKVENLLQAIYMLVFNVAVIFFMPMTYMAFTYLFSIPLLPGLLFIGLFIDLISLIFILATPLNQTLCDVLSRSVIIKNDDLDEIYRAKGYNV